MQHNLAMKLEERYTYKDYINWDDSEYWELIDGIAYQMAPPSTRHQEISGAIFNKFYNYLEDKTCKVYTAPFGVRLPVENEPDELIKNALLPDIVIVCDKNKIDEAGCRGTPDLIVEILSPSSSKRDLEDKLALYEKALVKEYWIVDPLNKFIQVYTLNENNLYGKAKVYSKDDRIKVSIFSDLEIDLTTVFKE
ncbi:MAG: Uma2 family endonuclease [Candidatus Eremiobacterota bacterium]